ncbi:hypothetical protein [Hyphococcus sp.]|uniref:hypothetical protein n=1 Tax=Hyphococcus sp. TaxID=2038636 RepID=UPI003CCB9E8B
MGKFFSMFLLPFRLLSRAFRSLARDAKTSSKTTASAGGAAIGRAAHADILQEEYREEPPTGVETLLFRQLPRPRLTERAASDLSLEQAQEYARNASGFYRFAFPLFTRGDFFYEEVEQDYLNASLGFERNSIDRRFLEVTTLFRKTLNANTRKMLLYWAPALYLIALGAAYWAVQSGRYDTMYGFAAKYGGAPALFYGGAAFASLVLAFFIFSWPYKVVQQRNLMNLDNYITSKFARINNNFQVAKRRALNVERDKRMGQREELKEEAGSWTLAYHWFAMRLMLCELALRNKFYQVRRNTALYWVGGLLATGVCYSVFLAAMIYQNAPWSVLVAFSAASAAYLLLAGAIMRRATAVMFDVLESNEWSRFHIVDLDAAIRDHVGEDKLQIVTFRDRNRFE